MKNKADTIKLQQDRSPKNIYDELNDLYRKNIWLPQEASTIIYVGEPRKSSSTEEIRSFLISLVKIWSKITPEIIEEIKILTEKTLRNPESLFSRIEKEANECLKDMAEKNYIFLSRDVKALFYDLEFLMAILQKIEGFEKLVIVREYSQMDFVHYAERMVKECEKPSWGHFWKKQNPQTGEWEMWKEDFDSSD